jgi:hypothetical protein
MTPAALHTWRGTRRKYVPVDGQHGAPGTAPRGGPNNRAGNFCTPMWGAAADGFVLHAA